MKYLKMLGVAAVAAMAFMAFASSASATTLATNGVPNAGPTTLTASEDGSITLARTDGSFANTCKKSHVHGTTSVTTGAAVTGALSSLSFSECNFAVEVVNAGALEVTHIAGTTNGTVFSENATVRTGSAFGNLHCVTGATKHIGTLTGKTSGNATMDIHAVLDCGFLVPSATWTGAYWITPIGGKTTANGVEA